MSTSHDAWTELGPGVLVRQSRAWRMNSLLLARAGRVLVVDPGVLPSELDDLAARVAALAPRPGDVVLAFTHPHWDHVLGRDVFPAAATLAHADFAAALERDAAQIDAEARACAEGAGEAWVRAFRPFGPEFTVRGGSRVELGPFAAVAYELPGHCPSQIALWLPAEGVLCAADTLSDIEIPWLDSPPRVYLRSLVALQELLEREEVRFLVPGHGTVARGSAASLRRVRRDADYLAQLERRVGEARARGLSLAETQAELARLDHPDEYSTCAMNDVHRDNVRFAYEDRGGTRGGADA